MKQNAPTLKGLHDYIHWNQAYIVSYEKTCSSAIYQSVAESHIDSLIMPDTKEMEKMQWSREGADNMRTTLARNEIGKWRSTVTAILGAAAGLISLFFITLLEIISFINLIIKPTFA